MHIPERNFIKAARGLLAWSIADLAKASGLSAGTVARLEAGGGCHLSTLKLVCETLAKAGVNFESSGLRVSTNNRGSEYESRQATP